MTEKDEIEINLNTITDQEQEWAQKALSEFQEKSYFGALQFIAKLSNTRSTDFKVLHNKAVLEYCNSDLKKTETFQKNLTSLCSQYKFNIERLDDVDQCIIYYNQAILLYHQKQYTEAIYIMERVYKFIEPMDDNLAKQVSLFSIELQLCVHRPDKALTLINYLENNLINGNGLKALDKKEKDRMKKVSVETDSDKLLIKKRINKYRIQCYLMNHDLEKVSKEIEALKDESGKFFAANLEYLKGNLEESQKLLCSVGEDAIKYSKSGESSTVMFYNNMGVIHHSLGKPNLACHYFQLALKEDLALTDNKSAVKDRVLHVLGGSRYHEIIHNLGISLLFAKKPTQAFDCLIIAVRRYHRNPRLWLRLAECCMMINKESNEIDFDFGKKLKEIVVDVIGCEDTQKVILTSNISKDRKHCTESQSYAIPVPSLEFASLCLRNASNLLPSDTEASPVPLLVIPGVLPPLPSSSPCFTPSSPLSSSGLMNLRNNILIATAYVGLCLGDYILAFENAKKVLKDPMKVSGCHKLLAHMYAAEALVLLDKITEALEFLNPENVKDISMDLPSDDMKVKTAPPLKWFPNSVFTAQATMQYNIAVCKTIRGQLEEAMTLLKQIWQLNGKCKVPGHIIMLVLYIELKLGRPEPARNLIKQFLFHNRG